MESSFIRLHRIPEALFPTFSESAPVTLLLAGADSLGQWLSQPLDPRIVCFETQALPENGEALPDPITAPDTPVPGIDYHLEEPANGFSTLYQLAQLAPRFPVRVTLPVRVGVEKAVKLAIALRLEILLEPGQPTPEEIERLAVCLDWFLHGHDTETGIEPFQSLLAAQIHGEPLTLWEIYERHPASTVEWTGTGEARIPGRLADSPETSAPGFLDHFPARATEHAECGTCPHLACCGGLFKWPDHAYDCTRLRERVLDPILAAADSLHTLLHSEPPSRL